MSKISKQMSIICVSSRHSINSKTKKETGTNICNLYDSQKVNIHSRQTVVITC